MRHSQWWMGGRRVGLDKYPVIKLDGMVISF